MRRVRLLGTFMCGALAITFCGCGTTGDGDGDGGGGGDGELMRVTFDSGGGNYAVGQDAAGNQYAFRAREEGDDTVLTEANFASANGSTLKASLDSEGRPVNFRLSNNTAADLVYDGDNVKIRLTDADGGVIAETGGIDTTTARVRVEARRALNRLTKGTVRMQTSPTKEQILQEGMEEYEVVVEAITDEADNPDSPLTKPEADDLKEAARALGDVVSDLDLEEVDRDTLGDEVDLDEVPAEIAKLAGFTYVLFEAEGFCVDFTDIANRLTFDNNGVLQTEFDRHLVFPSFSQGGSADPGVTFNYSTGTPVNLTPDEEEAGFSMIVTPVFTGTQMDDAGFMTIERRFQADLTFEVDLFVGPTEATAQNLFDAAFLGGTLSEDERILEFELVLVDLQEDNPPIQGGKLRYHNQNMSVEDEDLIFACTEGSADEDIDRGIRCPDVGAVPVGEQFEVSFLPGRGDDDRTFDYDWFVSDGYGYINGDPFSPETTVVAMDEGFLEVTLILHDLSADTGMFEVYTCGVNVGREDGGGSGGLEMLCPMGDVLVNEWTTFGVTGPGIDETVRRRWFVFGSSDFSIDGNDLLEPLIKFHGAGVFEVAFQGFTSDNTEYYASCEVSVRSGGQQSDQCAENGWYGDGECDLFCPRPDPDCGAADICEQNGWYGDGECDEFCPRPDPDCETFDVCEENGWYNDGECDDLCPRPDPDCQMFDICEENGWYNDGECDTFCPQPDPDCGETDWCADLGFYGDGFCDYECPQPDPDCGAQDMCEQNGWYGDYECDDFCPQPDPDCTDECVVNGWYGDGECDLFCPLPDPDCESVDVCEENLWYGDYECDDFCPQPDPDCTDECVVNGWYGDGECDPFCPLPDPDCDL